MMGVAVSSRRTPPQLDVHDPFYSTSSLHNMLPTPVLSVGAYPGLLSTTPKSHNFLTSPVLLPSSFPSSFLFLYLPIPFDPNRPYVRRRCRPSRHCQPNHLRANRGRPSSLSLRCPERDPARLCPSASADEASHATEEKLPDAGCQHVYRYGKAER
jgi:hypothetical protein